jgi:hypothetical protein
MLIGYQTILNMNGYLKKVRLSFFIQRSGFDEILKYVYAI